MVDNVQTMCRFKTNCSICNADWDVQPEALTQLLKRAYYGLIKCCHAAYVLRKIQIHAAK